MFKRWFGGDKTLFCEIAGPAKQVVTLDKSKTLLKNFLAAGVEISYDCQVGSCQKCLCRITGGKYRSLVDLDYVLSNQQIKENHVLACQTLPVSDISLNIVNWQQESTWTKAAISSVDKLSGSVYRVGIDCTDEAINFKPGQYCEIKNPLSGIVRSYSISWPSKGNRLYFDIALKSSGKLSPWLCNKSNINQTLLLSKAKGSFAAHLNASVGMVALAGGSGLGVIISVIEEVLRQTPSVSILLLHGIRNLSNRYDGEKLRQLSRQYPSFVYYLALSNDRSNSDSILQGRVTRHIPYWQKLVRGNESDQWLAAKWNAIVCGSEGFAKCSINSLIECGFVPDRIHVDVFKAAKEPALET